MRIQPYPDPHHWYSGLYSGGGIRYTNPGRTGLVAGHDGGGGPPYSFYNRELEAISNGPNPMLMNGPRFSAPAAAGTSLVLGAPLAGASPVKYMPPTQGFVNWPKAQQEWEMTLWDHATSYVQGWGSVWFSKCKIGAKFESYQPFFQNSFVNFIL